MGHDTAGIGQDRVGPLHPLTRLPAARSVPSTTRSDGRFAEQASDSALAPHAHHVEKRRFVQSHDPRSRPAKPGRGHRTSPRQAQLLAGLAVRPCADGTHQRCYSSAVPHPAFPTASACDGAGVLDACPVLQARGESADYGSSSAGKRARLATGRRAQSGVSKGRGCAGSGAGADTGFRFSGARAGAVGSGIAGAFGGGGGSGVSGAVRDCSGSGVGGLGVMTISVSLAIDSPVT
jgi:hypothetical protein